MPIKNLHSTSFLFALSFCLIPFSGPASAALLAYYSFDDDFTDGIGTNDLTSAGGGPITPATNITTTAGEVKFGSGALSLDHANNEWLSMTTELNFGLTDAWSVSFWAKQSAASLTNNSTGMVMGDSTTTASFIWNTSNTSQVSGGDNTGGLRFRPASGGVGAGNNNYAVGTNANYNHVVMVADGTGKLTVYYNNGPPIVTAAASGGTIFDINAIGKAYSSNGFTFGGQLDEIYIFDEAIDAAKVAELYSAGSDTTPPTLAGTDIVDDQGGGPADLGNPVTYTVTFSEDMNDSTVEAADFGNAGSSTFSIGTIAEVSLGVFTVEVTPTSIGTLQLQVNQSAILSDPAGNELDTSSAILDDTTITVISDNTPPTLVSSDIVDDLAGGPVAQGALVTYTVTFNEGMDDSTVTASDFGNAGSATISIGTVTETSPGVFSVEVTPTSLGTLQLQVNQNAVLSDLAGNDLDTTSAILDDTILSVEDLEPNLLAYYPFDSDYLDASGYGNHATQVDATTIGNSGITTAASASVFGGGAYFNAEQGDFIDIPDQVFANGDSWSVSMWSRKANNDATGMLIGDRGDTNNFMWHTSNFSGLRVRNAGGATTDITAPKDTAWHHWVFVADGASGKVTVYLDNAVLAPAFTFATGFEFREIADAYSSLNYAFIGEIDEVYIYGTAVDAAKVNQLYTNTLGPDTTAPTLVGIADNRAGGPVAPGSLVTYTVSFDEDMDALTVGADDFGNAGSAPTFSIGTINEISPGVFTVEVNPTSTGTLQLQVNQDAILSDTSGNDLDTSAAILDDTVITVETDNTNPTLATGDIEDDQGGGPVTANTLVTFTISFSEDIDDSTVDASDFGNAGTAPFSIGTITEISPGVFTVEMTPTSPGTLQLQVLAGSTITDASGNPLVTTTAITSDTTITVQEGFSPAGVRRLRLVLVGGQSNADGRAVPSGLPTSPVNLQLPQEDVDFFYRVEDTIYPLTTLRPGKSETGGFGPAITCGRHLADELADGITTRVAVIKYANGGTNLHTQWAAGGNNTTSGDGTQYVRFQETVTAGIAALSSTYPNAVVELVGMIWLQGESDAGTQAANYQTNLTNFIADVRLTYGADLRFVVIRLSDGQTGVGATLSTIQNAQTAVAAAHPLTALVDTNGLAMQDSLHFNPASQQQIGHASAIQLLNLHPFLTPLALAPQQNGDFKITVDQAFSGFLYTLKASSTLQAGDWAEVDSATASGPSVVFTVTPAPEETRRFFRVERTLAP